MGKKNILFRADASSEIGTGHIMRDLVLAKEYKDDNVFFATQKLKGNIDFIIEDAGYLVKTLASNHIDELITLIEKLQIDMIVIDHYGIDEAFEKELKNKTGITVFVFDDTYEKHYCDILLNHNIYADEKKYKNLVPKFCELRCGSEYTLLRDEFKELKHNKNMNKNKLFTFFVAMGGSDPKNLNSSIVEVLSEIPNIKVNIITTQANQNLEKLKKICENKMWIELHINCNNMAHLMVNSDFAIITPSVTANEVYYMNLPFLAIKVTENQEYMYQFLAQNNYPVLEGFDNEKFKALIEDIV
ncbi:MAG TPA: UDP-2,4-diacetamido-2,4,6-trideoxy-beta-L-altropyranose hydrolase [Arcobacter sp.]|jgi:UDP-2,4-diacetamido-2,4,6-trideoxy-beta-L-altropyranose hydrolase|nr:UDP-2,4-diacetamido-2,4,6-trideoxy-beta-L-altropyranose hydrolase [Arcobacter sp.]